MTPQPLDLPRLTGAIFRNRLKRMKKHGATGADSWRMSEILAPPDDILDMYAAVFQAFEDGAEWPPSLLYGLAPFLPRGGGSEAATDPTKQRPTTVLSIRYRCYASIRRQQVMAWQLSWFHPSPLGGIPKEETSDIPLEVALEIELAKAVGGRFYVIALDETKCYDSVVRDIALGAAQALGAPPGLIDA